MIGMRRRELLAVVSGATLSRALPSVAQATGISRIGYLGSNEKDSAVIRAFLQGLSEHGYSDGRNIELR